MKKGKKQVSKVGTNGFSLSKEKFDFNKVFKGYPLEIPYSQERNIEQDSYIELEYILQVLLWADKHPPNYSDGVFNRSSYFCVVFESREQKDEFLHECDLYRISDKYLEAEVFADAFGIDLQKGTRDKKAKPSGLAFGKTNFNFANSFNFGTSEKFGEQYGSKKPEVSERLREVRANEKDLAKYMEWCSEPEYWFCLAFRNEQEKQNCLKALGLEAEYGGRYIWCHDLAKVLEMELIPCTFKNKGEYIGHDKRIEAMIYRGEKS